MGFYQGGVGLDGDLFGHGADRQNGIHCRIAIDLEHETGLHELAEARLGDFQHIRANGKIREHIGAVRSARCGTDRAGGRLRHFECSTGHTRTAGIFHGAVNLSRRPLCPESGSQNDQAKRTSRESTHANLPHKTSATRRL